MPQSIIQRLTSGYTWLRPSRKARKTAFELEPGLRIYAIGDIHGRLDLLEKMVKLIAEDELQSPSEFSLAIFLGDYVDRGPTSKGVLDHLIEAPRVCDEYVFLRGNHEEILLNFLADESVLLGWSQYGGLETLYSYGIKPRLPLNPAGFRSLHNEFNRRFPRSHRNFLSATRTSFEVGDYFFVHAGVRPGIPLSAQKREDLLWIRDEFIFSTRRFEKVVVHGHTPVEAPEVLSHRINVDTGAYLTGRLSCIVLEKSNRRILTT